MKKKDIALTAGQALVITLRLKKLLLAYGGANDEAKSLVMNGIDTAIARLESENALESEENDNEGV